MIQGYDNFLNEFYVILYKGDKVIFTGFYASEDEMITDLMDKGVHSL